MVSCAGSSQRAVSSCWVLGRRAFYCKTACSICCFYSVMLGSSAVRIWLAGLSLSRPLFQLGQAGEALLQRQGGMMSYQDILYKVTDGVAVVTFNRPEALNAATTPMHAEIRDALAAAVDDSKVRVIVLTGAGRGFCAGADMKSLQAAAKGEPNPYGEAMQARELKQNRNAGRFGGSYSFFPSIPKPVIAAVNGPAAGIGFVMMLYADMRFASDRAVVSSAFSRRGLIAEWGSSWILPRIVGVAHANDILMSGRRVDAEEGLRMGLYNRVIAHDNLMEETLAYAREMAQYASPKSVSVIKEQIYADLNREPQDGHEIAVSEMRESLRTDDFKEGIAHFLEKRPPNFKGI